MQLGSSTISPATASMAARFDQVSDLFGRDGGGFKGGLQETDSPNDALFSAESIRMRTTVERVRILLSRQTEGQERSHRMEELAAADLPEDQRPEAVAERIIRFVVGMAGEDPEMLERLIKAVEQGFQEAEAIFGGKLPDVSYETMKLVRQALAEALNGLGGDDAGAGPAAVLELSYEREETTFEYFNYTARGVPAQQAQPQPAASVV